MITDSFLWEIKENLIADGCLWEIEEHLKDDGCLWEIEEHSKDDGCLWEIEEHLKAHVFKILGVCYLCRATIFQKRYDEYSRISLAKYHIKENMWWLWYNRDITSAENCEHDDITLKTVNIIMLLRVCHDAEMCISPRCD